MKLEPFYILVTLVVVGAHPTTPSPEWPTNVSTSTGPEINGTGLTTLPTEVTQTQQTTEAAKTTKKPILQQLKEPYSLDDFGYDFLRDE
ncbi:unnamed protein product [Mesocestoides corti]|uniref:Secreted protein n=1 Tax=Mesocestoides corti TaxID=53468 RepID=A0A0R3UL20_MESCO|nr:unnamed protein product [Mesocestoides corti]